MVASLTRSLIRERLGREIGRIDKQSRHAVALAYPSPYFVGMSSLGFQRVYRLIQDLPEMSAERCFLADGADVPGSVLDEAPVSYERERPLGEFRVVAFSVAYELELAGLIKMLDAARIPLTWRERAQAEARGGKVQMPFVVIGGPLTFSNPTLLGPFADAVLVGEAEGVLEPVLREIFAAGSNREARQAVAKHPHWMVPEVTGDLVPPVAVCDEALLPAESAIRTPDTELSNMFLIEPERGCSRGCTYCVMRRTSVGGMRIVDAQTILERIPDDAQRVGLVGAAVSDHPQIVALVSELARRGKTVGLSSLRPDRLKDEFVAALKAAGYRTLTTALDGASQRLRDHIERRGREPDYERAAELARKEHIERLKLYLMLGLPGETPDDIDECAAFVSKLSRRIPVALSVAPFCAKKNTPLDGMPFAGIRVVSERVGRLRRGLAGRAEVKATSPRWAWVEHVMSQGGQAEALAVVEAVRRGGRFSDYRRAFELLGHSPEGKELTLVAVPRGELGQIRARRQLKLLATAAAG